MKSVSVAELLLQGKDVSGVSLEALWRQINLVRLQRGKHRKSRFPGFEKQPRSKTGTPFPLTEELPPPGYQLDHLISLKAPQGPLNCHFEVIRHRAFRKQDTLEPGPWTETGQMRKWR